MKAKELIELLREHEDFDVEFVFSDGVSPHGLNVRVFNNLSLADIGHSDKVVRLSGDET